MQSILELPSVPAEKRRAWLEFWVASQPAQLAVSAFVHELAPLLSEAEIASFLDAERLWVPLSGSLERLKSK